MGDCITQIKAIGAPQAIVWLPHWEGLQIGTHHPNASAQHRLLLLDQPEEMLPLRCLVGKASVIRESRSLIQPAEFKAQLQAHQEQWQSWLLAGESIVLGELAGEGTTLGDDALQNKPPSFIHHKHSRA